MSERSTEHATFSVERVYDASPSGRSPPGPTRWPRRAGTAIRSRSWSSTSASAAGSGTAGRRRTAASTPTRRSSTTSSRTGASSTRTRCAWTDPHLRLARHGGVPARGRRHAARLHRAGRVLRRPRGAGAPRARHGQPAGPARERLQAALSWSRRLSRTTSARTPRSPRARSARLRRARGTARRTHRPAAGRA